MVFTDESEKILKYIKTKVKHSINYKEYKDLFNAFKKVSFNIKIIKVVDFLKEYVKVESPFISDDIFENIKKLKKHKNIIFKTNNSTIHLNVYYKNEDLKKFLNRIIEAICFMFNMSDHNVEICTINYYLVDNKKIIQTNKNYLEDHLSQKEVNSGSCSHDTINIWRKEEVLKVTIHEVIHLLNYDLKNVDTILKEVYKKKYNVTSDRINIYEAYTEIWANLINIYLIIKDETTIKKSLKLFSQYIEYEKFFVNYQACKIFFITGLCDKVIDIDKHTNILPYYIIRNEIFSDLRKFLNYCKEKNSNYIKLNGNLNNFLFDSKKCKKNNRLFTNSKKTSIIYNTTRMTSIELNLFNSQE